MYSLMSKRTSSMPSCSASCLVTSVLPTPVGPANRKLPIGLSGLARPERASLIAEVRVSIAGSWPKITRSEEHTSELQSLMRISYAVFCLKKKKNQNTHMSNHHIH